MIDIQTAFLSIIILLCQCYIGYTIFHITHEKVAALIASALPLGLGLYFVQVGLLERIFPGWHLPDNDRYWLQWSYAFVMIQYIAAAIIYMDFFTYS
ncbi:hypothetical protein ERX27_03000 [Macrococcus brunensis]|uniref:Uncharacterized protein n=1 Tax=Macrococcus brunensis TaxID=198483 RepID=A0A4R6BF77_9STAP|nr:hypothetical protein [Macrococcus brunensis]TDL98418.1 hypothetical protein ERX27_03000 [Macrococcus brunensis]